MENLKVGFGDEKKEILDPDSMAKELDANYNKLKNASEVAINEFNDNLKSTLKELLRALDSLDNEINGVKDYSELQKLSEEFDNYIKVFNEKLIPLIDKMREPNLKLKGQKVPINQEFKKLIREVKEKIEIVNTLIQEKNPEIKKQLGTEDRNNTNDSNNGEKIDFYIPSFGNSSELKGENTENSENSEKIKRHENHKEYKGKFNDKKSNKKPTRNQILKSKRRIRPLRALALAALFAAAAFGAKSCADQVIDNYNEKQAEQARTVTDDMTEEERQEAINNYTQYLIDNGFDDSSYNNEEAYNKHLEVLENGTDQEKRDVLTDEVKNVIESANDVNDVSIYVQPVEEKYKFLVKIKYTKDENPDSKEIYTSELAKYIAKYNFSDKFDVTLDEILEENYFADKTIIINESGVPEIKEINREMLNEHYQEYNQGQDILNDIDTSTYIYEIAKNNMGKSPDDINNYNETMLSEKEKEELMQKYNEEIANQSQNSNDYEINTSGYEIHTSDEGR